MTAPILTVLMTVRNGERHLKDAIASILNQTYHNFRFLIIDNASPDMPQKNCGVVEIIISGLLTNKPAINDVNI